MSALSVLSDPSLTIVFATSPTGLGHLRVTDALYHGLPKTAYSVLLGAQDPMTSATYRFICIHPITKRLMEMLQEPPFDESLAYIGSKMLRTDTKVLYQQLKTILDERMVTPKTVLLIAPHTILAHKLGEIKQKLAKEMGVNILLVVQVTDDSPQPIWYIQDADLIMVPSHHTQETLLRYAKKARLPLVPVVVGAYPISPLLTKELSEHAFEQRAQQVNPSLHVPIHVSVPISGAAVGTSFTSTFIQSLHHLSKRFVFQIVSREANYTNSFNQMVSQLPYVTLYSSKHDRTLVDHYERIYKEWTIGLEVTKPSEQTFKTLATPKERCGAILLLTKPVGGQEYDNLFFLRKHALMPTRDENRLMWKMAANGEHLESTDLLTKARHWRALRLPDDPHDSSKFTLWCLQEKVFFQMLHYTRAHLTDELKSNGVEQFWANVAGLLEKQQMTD